MDLIQIIDIAHTFFTAKKVRNLTQYVQKLRKKEITNQEKTQGLNVQKAQEVMWEINQKWITIDYLMTFFVMDILAIIPFFMGGSSYWLALRFFRLFRINRIL